MARKGKIDELYDLDKIQQQQDKVIGLVNEFIDKIGTTKPIAIKLEGAEKTSEVVSGIKALNSETQSLVKTTNLAVNEMGKLSVMTKTYSGSLTEQKNILDKVNGSFEQNIQLQLKYKARLDEIKKSQKELNDAYKNGQVSADEYSNKIIELNAEQKQLQEANKQLSTTLRNQAKELNSAEGSLEQLQARLTQLQQVYTSLSEDDPLRGFFKGEIDKLLPKVKELEGGIGQFNRNVGNYSGAVKILEKAFEEVKTKIDQFNKSGEKNDQILQQLQKEYELLDQVLSNQANGFVSMRSEIQANEVAIENLIKLYGEDDAKVKELIKTNSKLRDSFNDLKAQQKTLGSDTFAFDALLQGGQALVGIYTSAQGAAALFGDENEDLQRTFVKLQASMALVQGVQAVVNALQKESALVQGILVVKERALAAAMIIKNFVLNGSVSATRAQAAATLANTTATQGATVATRVFSGAMVGLRTALIATGIGALLLLLPAVANAMSGASNETKSWDDRLKELKVTNPEVADSLEELGETIEDVADNYIKHLKDASKELREELGLIPSEAEKAKEILDGLFQKKNEVQAKLLGRKVAGAGILELFGFGEGEEDIEDELDRINRRITDTQKFFTQAQVAQAREAGIKKTEQTKENGLYELQVQEQIDIAKQKAAGATEEAIFKTQQQYQQLRIKLLEQFNTLLAKQQPGEATRLEKETNDAKNKLLIDQLNFQATVNAKARQNREKELKAAFELQKFYAQKEIDFQKAIADDKDSPAATRFNALMDALVKEERAIKAQRDFDLRNQQLTESERKLIVARAEDQILEIRKKAGDKVIQIQANTKDLQKKIFDDLREFRRTEADKEISELTNNLSKQIDAEQKAADFAIQFELGRYKTGQINKEQYENKKLEIENDFRRKSLLFEIDYYEKLLKIANLGPEKEAEALQKLSALRKQLNDLDVKNTEDSLNKQDKALSDFLKASKEKLIELGNALKDTLFSLLEGGVDRRKNELQEEIDLIDKRTQKEIDAAAQTSASEQDKAAKIAIISARAQAQKEQLEKRQRQLDEQKARFEKARAVTDVIQNTAMAVTGYLAEQNYALAIISGIIGAAQLVKILAQPIPKYAQGTDDHPGGLAEVGDGGKNEYIQTPDGRIFETPDRSTLVDLPAHSKVFEDEDALHAAMVNQSMRVLALTGGKGQKHNSDRIESAIGKMEKSVVKAIHNMPQPHIFVENPLKRWVKTGNSIQSSNR